MHAKESASKGLEEASILFQHLTCPGELRGGNTIYNTVLFFLNLIVVLKYLLIGLFKLNILLFFLQVKLFLFIEIPQILVVIYLHCISTKPGKNCL